MQIISRLFNTVRLYNTLLEYDHTGFLDVCHKYGVKVILTFPMDAVHYPDLDNNPEEVISFLILCFVRFTLWASVRPSVSVRLSVRLPLRPSMSFSPSVCLCLSLPVCLPHCYSGVCDLTVVWECN